MINTMDAKHPTNNREKEVKFYLREIDQYIEKLNSMNAVLKKKRVHEVNLRFDSVDGTLRAQHHVLRLRKDDQVRLTYKGAANLASEVADRQELEVVVQDLDTTRAILEALGFQVFILYEKYRTTYKLQDCEVVVDEMPFGNFTEIEGNSVEAIHALVAALDLDWEKRITASYLQLFHHLQQKYAMDVTNLAFDEFKDCTFTEKDFLIV